ncbi:uncharacterized protein [Rutidosis leptorrhynchoides]|uniref:uncharacterized protein n=1 Tax=Rutidosis leptorrhynchoides TaxID=125765 RepID=UPI003A99E885
MNYDGAMWMIFGDFNEVRFASERKNTFFFKNRAKWFNDFIKEGNMIDVPLGGRLYTRISDNGHKFSKLDRFLISENVLENWPNLNAVVLDKKYTDHCPIMLKEGNIDFGPKPIKVFDEWTNHKDAPDIVRKAWNTDVNGWKPDYIFREKLKQVKMELKKWYSTSQCKLKGDIDELTKLEAQHKNNIHEVNVNGVWTTDPAAIKTEAHKFFENLFSSNQKDSLRLENWNGHRIDKVLADKLEEEFSEHKTLEAIKSCGKNKAPGPDGFNLLFYVKFWEIIKGGLMRAITWFWRTESFPFNYLGLPIGANPKLYKNWAPIFDKFKKRLADWKCKTISFGGRLTLIKSVLTNLPLYYFSLFKAPVGFLKELEGLRRDFFWGGSGEQKKMAWVQKQSFGVRNG